MRKVLLLFNSLLERKSERALPLIAEVFRQADIEVEAQESGSGRAGGEKARQASRAGIGAVIVCGGDGTVFDVVQGLAGSKTPLGIVPLGTGNVLAQNLKIPKNPTAAARALLAGKTVTVPLGRITCGTAEDSKSWFFAMSAGIGGHAKLMQAARRSQKRSIGRAAYFAAGIKLLLQLRPQLFEIEVTGMDDRVERRMVCEALAVRVAELNMWRPGGGLHYPFLRLATVEGTSVLHLTGAAVQALLGSGGRRDRVAKPSPARYEDVLKVVCSSLHQGPVAEPLPVQADGEILGASYAVIEMAGKSIDFLTGRHEPAVMS